MLFDDINNFSECFLDKSVLSKTLPLHGALLISQFSVNGPLCLRMWIILIHNTVVCELDMTSGFSDNSASETVLCDTVHYTESVHLWAQHHLSSSSDTESNFKSPTIKKWVFLIFTSLDLHCAEWCMCRNTTVFALSELPWCNTCNRASSEAVWC